MGGTCSTYGSYEKFIYGFGGEMKERGNFEDLHIN